MSTRFRVIGLLGLAAIITAVAIPSLTGAQTSGARQIIVREKVRAVKIVDVKPRSRRERLSIGDRVLTRQKLFDESNKRVGTLFTDCVGVGQTTVLFKATLQCVATYRLGRGQVVASGVVRLSDRNATAGIVGGTRAYRGAKGQISPGAPARGYQSVDVISLDG